MVRVRANSLTFTLRLRYTSPVFILNNNDLSLADILAFHRNTENDGKSLIIFNFLNRSSERTAKRNCTAHALSENFPFPFPFRGYFSVV